jgi:hypothetical protein
MKTTLQAAAALVLVFIVTAGCSGGSDKPKPTPTSHAPITDSAPYWCAVVPKKGLQAASGRPAADLEESSVPAPDATPTVPIRCSVGQTALQFERATGATAQRYFAQKPPVGSEPHTRRVPKELGEGAASGQGDQWHVYARFRCGKTTNLFTLSITGVAKGRDTDADLIALMRIAQQRYAQEAGCALAGSGADA